MHKLPGGNNSHSSTKGSVKKDVVSVACQTDNNGSYGSGSSSPIEPSLSQDSTDMSMPSNPNVPSSNASDRTAIRTPRDGGKQQSSAGCAENATEGTITMTIPKFSAMGDTLCSQSKKVQGVPWRIMVMPKQHVVQKKQQKCMGFFLQCCPEKVYSDAWSCKADAEMRLMSKKQGVNNFVRKTSHVYTSKENDWGYSCFMTWADVLDENQGYIKEDKITLEITVKAEPPKNLMTRDEFVKAIDQWYNLAEMQMNRGMIDLSLEANAQGLKFCKDKDDEMKIKLEEQKQRLVKKKVLDSINRIENTGGQPKSSEPLKPTSLRAALTGAQKTIVSKNGKASANKRDRKTFQQIRKKKQENAAKQDQGYVPECKGHGKADSKCEYWPTTPRSSYSDTCVSYDRPPPASPTYSEAGTIELFNDSPIRCRSARPSEPVDASVSDGGEDGDDEDYSDYYNEDEEAMENQLSEHEESLRCSSSSLEQTLGETVDGCCQTDPSLEQEQQPAPRRERMHFVFNHHPSDDEEDEDVVPVELPASPEPQHPAGNPAEEYCVTPGTIAARFLDEIKDESSDLFKRLTSAKATVDDRDKINEWCRLHFGDVPKIQEILMLLERAVIEGQVTPELYADFLSFGDELSTCGITIGLCAVTSRRCAEAARDFKKLINETFKDEYKLTSKAVADNNRHRPGQESKKDMPPGDFTLNLADDAVSGQPGDRKSRSGHQEQSEKSIIYPITECEKSVEKLFQDMGQNKFDFCIASKIQDMLELKDYNAGLVTLLTQLFNYFHNLMEQKTELQKSLEMAKNMCDMKARNGGLAYKTQVLKDNEKRLQESEVLIKKIGQQYQLEAEKNKKLDVQLTEEQTKLKAALLQIEQLQVQLKEARNLTKKAEKKAKQEETKNATLLADKLDLEDKLKAARKETDQLKKKSADERNNAKKQKDRDTETIRRLENENAEKEAEKEREKGIFEEKLREVRTKENRAEKDRKQAQASCNTAVERARLAEATQINLMYELQQHRFAKTQEEIQAGTSEAEKNLKRAHNTQADLDTMKKNLAEWKAVSEELEKLIKDTKTDYDHQAEQVKKGQVLFSQLELHQPTLPILPKTIRLPPVQVVQPSTSALLPPTIVTPPAGVIGQPRASGAGAGVIGQPSSRPQVSAPPPSQMNGSMPGPSSYNSMKMSSETAPSAGPTLPPPPSSISTPGMSIWNWSTPLETVTASVFRANSSIDHARSPQTASFDDWGHRDDFSAQALNRAMYNSQPGQAPVNWANAPGWQRPSSAQHGMAPQQPQQYRGLPPYHHYQ